MKPVNGDSHDDETVTAKHGAEGVTDMQKACGRFGDGISTNVSRIPWDEGKTLAPPTWKLEEVERAQAAQSDQQQKEDDKDGEEDDGIAPDLLRSSFSFIV